jgi:hypothetical protein
MITMMHPIAFRGLVFSLSIWGYAWALHGQEGKSVTSTASAVVVVGALLYQNDFEKAEPGKVPEDLLVLDGAFDVKADGQNKFLELPGAPLETFGVLFGPTETNSLGVSARIQGTAKGRRFPTFGIGLNGVGGYKLQVSPSKKLIELSRGEQVLGSAPYSWESDSWTKLRLQVRKVKADEWKIEGKAWKHGTAEPESWTVALTDQTEPAPGRASIWGAPYAGTPIRFDDLQVIKLQP